MGAATRAAGPLNAKTRSLVGLAIAIGARHEGAVHSHTRKALEAGCTAKEIRHAVLLSVTTLGFPNMMAALSWVDDVLNH
jgi:alkylhydroperoxidase/carboxymuconolactone decarboxylase family protein YurZ